MTPAQREELLSKLTQERDAAESSAAKLAAQCNKLSARAEALAEQLGALEKKLAAADSSSHRYLAELNQLRMQRADQFAARLEPVPAEAFGQLTGLAGVQCAASNRSPVSRKGSKRIVVPENPARIVISSER